LRAVYRIHVHKDSESLNVSGCRKTRRRSKTRKSFWKWPKQHWCCLQNYQKHTHHATARETSTITRMSLKNSTKMCSRCSVIVEPTVYFTDLLIFEGKLQSVV